MEGQTGKPQTDDGMIRTYAGLLATTQERVRRLVVGSNFLKAFDILLNIFQYNKCFFRAFTRWGKSVSL